METLAYPEPLLDFRNVRFVRERVGRRNRAHGMDADPDYFSADNVLYHSLLGLGTMQQGFWVGFAA